MMEVWKDISGYIGLYQVSTKGNIMSLDRIIDRKGNAMSLKGVALKKQLGSNGYHQVTLSKCGKIKTCLVHRLVAKTFNENPNNFNEVNHINEIKTDNRIENLEWVTPKENSNHGTAIERRVKKANFKGSNNPMFGKIGVKNKRSIGICQYDLNGSFIKEFASSATINKELGYNASSITGVARGRLKQAYGFIWKYK